MWKLCDAKRQSNAAGGTGVAATVAGTNAPSTSWREADASAERLT